MVTQVSKGMSLLRSRVTLAALALAVCVACAVVYFAAGRPVAEAPNGVLPSAGVEGLDYGFEVRDERQLVGDADNVFVGRVLKQVGSEEPLYTTTGDPGVAPASPKTRFSIEVEENIKGDLSGAVEVNQDGGYATFVATEGPEEGKRLKSIVLFENDPLLEPGRRYVFVTNFDPERGHQQISTPGYGKVPVGDEPDEKAHGPLVGKFKKAHKEQIDPARVKVPNQAIPPEYLEGEDVHEHSDGGSAAHSH